MPPKRKHDRDVWGPPPPLPATPAPVPSSSRLGAAAGGAALNTSTPASAFQSRFANRMEVVGKDGAIAQLGVKATITAAPPAAASVSAIPDTRAQRIASVKKKKTAAGGGAEVVRIVAPSEATHVQKAQPLPPKRTVPVVLSMSPPPVHTRNTPITAEVESSDSPAVLSKLAPPPQRANSRKNNAASTIVVEVDMGSSSGGSDGGDAARHPPVAPAPQGPSLSRRSSSITVATPDPKVRCLLAPSALASPYGGCGERTRRPSAGGYPVTPPASAAAARLVQRPSSAASTSPSYASATPPRQQVKGVRFSPPLPEPQPVKAAKSIDGGSEGSRLTRAAPAMKPPMPTPSPTLPPVARGPTCLSSASADSQPHAAQGTGTSVTQQQQQPGYKPRTLRSYRTLMADFAERKFGGLGPSDTDAQRAAKEKRERARAYAERAARIARHPLTGEGEGGEEEMPTDGQANATQGHQRGDSEASTATSRSSSWSSSDGSDTPTSSSNSERRKTKGGPSAPGRAGGTAAPTQSPYNKKLSQPQDVVREERKPVRRRRSPSPNPSPQSPAGGGGSGPAFAVAAASRREAKLARARRERALAYAQKIAQERQEQQQQLRAAAEATQASSLTDDDVEKAAFAVDGGSAAVDAAGAARRQRLMDLEAAHRQKQTAVEHIRRQLRGVPVKNSGVRER